MFLAVGPTALRFCEWVDRLGEAARVLDSNGHIEVGDDVGLLHLEASTLLAGPQGPALRAALDAARGHGALISIDLGVPEWIQAYGSSQTAYHLATIRPDVLFAGQASAAELATPLEGIAAVPVTMLGSEGCAVYGRRLVAPAGSELDEVALAAAFCVAFMEGAAPVEAAGRAVLVAARLPATTTRGLRQQ
jgi:sugar/nucleoside kinase (ribokinase family)